MKAEGRMTSGEWKTLPLGNFAESVDYGVTASATQQPIGPKFLRITDIQDGAVNWDDVPWCECDSRSSSGARLKPGDIVFARTGATTGKSFLIRDCPNDAVFASYLIRVRVGASAEPRFVSHFFQTADYWAQIAKGARGVAQPGVNATTLKALEIPLPPLAEQRRIAEVLDRAEALRAKRRAALSQLDSLTQSLFLDLFGDPVSNPMAFPVRPLGTLADNRDSVRVPVKQSDRDQRPGRYPYYGAVGVIDDIDDYLFDGPHLLISEDGKHLESRNRPVACLADGRFWVNNHAHVLEFNGEAELVFLSYTLELRSLAPYVTGIDQFKLNRNTLDSIPVAVPPMPLQREFARRVTAVETLKTAHRASLAELDALFGTLQHRAFRGEL